MARASDRVRLPRIHALILCDEIRFYSGSRMRLDLLGVRDQFVADDFPYLHPQFLVNLRCSAHAGMHGGIVSIFPEWTSDDAENAVAREPIPPTRFTGPLDFTHIPVLFERTVFPEPGVYWIRVYWGNLLCSEYRLPVEQREEVGS